MGDERRDRFLRRGWRVCRGLGMALLILGLGEAIYVFAALAGSGWKEWPQTLRSANPVAHLVTGYFFLLGANLIKALLEVIEELKTTV